MLRAMLVTVLSLAMAAVAQGADTGDAAVRAAFMRYDKGWRDFDVNEILSVCALDVEWTNSVGIRIRGREDYRKFLHHIFGEPSYRAGKSGALTIHAVRMLGPDAAVVSSSEPTLAQIDPRTGRAVPEINTNNLTVMQKRDGRWLVVNDLSSDESHGI